MSERRYDHGVRILVPAISPLLVTALLSTGCHDVSSFTLDSGATLDRTSPPPPPPDADPDSGSEEDSGSGDCPPGRSRCGDLCVDLMTAPQHCGRCSEVCATTEVCEQGLCSRTLGGVMTGRYSFPGKRVVLDRDVIVTAYDGSGDFRAQRRDFGLAVGTGTPGGDAALKPGSWVHYSDPNQRIAIRPFSSCKATAEEYGRAPVSAIIRWGFAYDAGNSRRSKPTINFSSCRIQCVACILRQWAFMQPPN